MRTHWRDCKAWIDDGLPLSTTNNECCKLYDAAVTQLCGFYNDPSLGGLEKTINGMLTADPEFLMGHVFKNIIKGDKINTINQAEFNEEIKEMVDLSERQNVTERERKHVNAVKLIAEGERVKAMDIWENILIDHPTDLLACRNAVFLCGVALGVAQRYRDVTSRALYAYTPTTPGYSNLLGWHAFGLEETKFFDKADRLARLSLEIEPRETWAHHTIAHIHSMCGNPNEGVDFMNSTVADWNTCDMLACHNHWHTALLYIDQGNLNDALRIFDDEILPRASSTGTMFSIVDGSSLLYRLELEGTLFKLKKSILSKGIKAKERWDELYELSHKHTGNNNWIFQDVHLMMIASNSKNITAADKVLNGLKEFARKCTGDNALVTKHVGVTLCEAIKAYAEGEYDIATDLLLSIRYEIHKIGGSTAQRDLFNQLLIHSSIKSTKKEHNKNARMLLAERKALKEDDRITDKLMAQTLQRHVSSEI